MTETYAIEGEAGRNDADGPVRVWDPLVRIFHWGLVVAFVVAYLSAEELSTVHEVAGYVVAGLVAFRLIWRFVGSRYARFSQFLKGPSATVRYLSDMVGGRERRYLGHNPAGAVMVVALLIALSGTAFTGWMRPAWRCCPMFRRSWRQPGPTRMATNAQNMVKAVKAQWGRCTKPLPT